MCNVGLHALKIYQHGFLLSERKVNWKLISIHLINVLWNTVSPNYSIVSSEGHRPLLCIRKYCSHKPWDEKSIDVKLFSRTFLALCYICNQAHIVYLRMFHKHQACINTTLLLWHFKSLGHLTATTLCKQFMI